MADYMTRKVYTLKPNSTVADAIQLMKKTKHDSFPVVDDDNRLVGYVSAVDIVGKTLETKIEEVMSRELYVAREFMSLRDAARVMFRSGHSKLPVVDENNRVVGIISNADVIRSQIERANPEKIEKLRKTIEKVHGVSTLIKKEKVEIARLIPTQSKVYADELKGRIEEIKRGLAEPIVVVEKDSRLYLVDGHHRVVAAMKLGIKELDAYIILVPPNIELGFEKLVKRLGLKSVKDMEIVEDVSHPLVEITFRNLR